MYMQVVQQSHANSGISSGLDALWAAVRRIDYASGMHWTMDLTSKIRLSIYKLESNYPQQYRKQYSVQAYAYWRVHVSTSGEFGHVLVMCLSCAH